MNPYVALAARINTSDAASLSSRLTAWHDAMVTHERTLRRLPASHACDEECPHTEARDLWREAVMTFGSLAEDLRFLRSRANPSVDVSRADVSLRNRAIDDVIAGSFPASDPPSWNPGGAHPDSPAGIAAGNADSQTGGVEL
jgi:hypothetical protein